MASAFPAVIKLRPAGFPEKGNPTGRFCFVKKRLGRGSALVYAEVHAEEDGSPHQMLCASDKTSYRNKMAV